MRERSNSTPYGSGAPAVNGEWVSIFVPDDHPLIQLKRELNWEELEAVMVKHWRVAGKNVDGGPGLPWPSSFYTRALVLEAARCLDSRKMEEQLKENGVVRAFMEGIELETKYVRDHSNLARARAALSEEGQEEVNQLLVRHGVELGYARPETESSDTTVQEPQIGYPNEPGILKGLAERCGRKLRKLKERGVEKAAEALETVKEIVRQVKHHHLFAQTKEVKKQVLEQIVEQTERLLEQSKQVMVEVGREVGAAADRVKQGAVKMLRRMGEVGQALLPQIKYWMETGRVATGKIIHAGLDTARAIVKGKKNVKFGFKWLITRLSGGYLFGRMVEAQADERKMPLESLKDYREIFGEEATPKMAVYDRGGSDQKTIAELKRAGVEKVGIPPRGKAAWEVEQADQVKVKSERGKTEGSIGTLKSQKYGFNHCQERSEETVKAVGQWAMVSVNLNNLMRDLVKRNKAVQAVGV